MRIRLSCGTLWDAGLHGSAQLQPNTWRFFESSCLRVFVVKNGPQFTTKARRLKKSEGVLNSRVPFLHPQYYNRGQWIVRVVNSSDRWACGRTKTCFQNGRRICTDAH